MKYKTGEEIKAARKKLRLQQKHLAAFCDISAEHMNRIEADKAMVPGYVDTIVALITRDKTAIAFLIAEKGLEKPGTSAACGKIDARVDKNA